MEEEFLSVDIKKNEVVQVFSDRALKLMNGGQFIFNLNKMFILSVLTYLNVFLSHLSQYYMSYT